MNDIYIYKMNFYKVSKLVKFPIDSGMVPLKLLVSKNLFFKIMKNIINYF